MYSQSLTNRPLQDLEGLFGTITEPNAVKRVVVEERASETEFILELAPSAIAKATNALKVPFAARNQCPPVEVRIQRSRDIDFVWKSPTPPSSLEVKWSLHGTQVGSSARDLGPVAGLLGSCGVDGFLHHKGTLPNFPNDVSSLRLGFTVQTDKNAGNLL